ncbi:heat shock factor 2-binding protein isoform X4 [Mesocricetus auratus]|uniref:Heat shock factor 2-binding protein isoform X4 n=1 Tax=Mesocricetus auratus TaxID=10036 RepID=A0A3Q0CRD9_MESAU|nr:heat shock factor 2-binding protein isoform X4 [Mesocricetus auratus]
MAASGGEVAAMGEGSGIEEAFRYIESKEEFVKVRKKDLERLTTEVMQLRDFLPRLLNAELMESFQKLNVVEKNLERKEQELEQLRLDCEHFKARLETVQADSGREKKEKLALRQQLNEAKQQLLQQAEYCTQMGAVTCTLLWGVSSSEEVVKAILGGDKALKFFNITGQTMESYVKSLDGDVKEVDSDENQFVFALAGIVTNVAAMACGREFLVNSSRVLLDTMLQLLGDLKPGQCTKLKVSRCRSVPSCLAAHPVCGSRTRGLFQGGPGAPELLTPGAHPGHVQEPQLPPADCSSGAPGRPPCPGLQCLSVLDHQGLGENASAPSPPQALYLSVHN